MVMGLLFKEESEKAFPPRRTMSFKRSSVYLMTGPNNFFFSYTVNMSELYTTIQYNKKNYSIDEFSSIGFDIGLNFFENSIFYREQNVSSVAKSKDEIDTIDIKYANRLLGYRYYF